MNDEIELILDMVKDSMNESIKHLEHELVKIRAGKASPVMLESVRVDYYGSQVPLSQVANINTLDARTISVQPWEKGMIEPIQKGIINSNLGLAPQNNGEQILLSIPPLTEERRKILVKQAKNEGENAKVSIRSSRKDANDQLKKLLKDGLPEDVIKSAEDSVQKITNDFIQKADNLVEKKEKDIMTV